MENPNYQCLAYRRQAPIWACLDDVFGGAERWLGRDIQGFLHPTKKARVYLPQQAAESDADYLTRLAQSPFIDVYAQAIRKFTNLIFVNPLEFTGEDDHPFRQHFTNIDNQGTDGEQFLRQVSMSAMKYGHTFLLDFFKNKLRGQNRKVGTTKKSDAAVLL